MVGATVFSAALLAAAQAVFASPVARSGYSVKDSHNVPRHWTKVARAPADHVMNIQIGLKQSNFPELERQLYEGMHTLSHLPETLVERGLRHLGPFL
jgi:tripeptidyl-peptidase-1